MRVSHQTAINTFPRIGRQGLVVALILSLGFNLSGCLADDVGPEVLNTYSVGGEVAGLGENPVVLTLNDGVEALSISEDGTFEFRTALKSGRTYEVVVEEHPGDHKVCDIDAATGTVHASGISDVMVSCSELFLGATSANRKVVVDWERDAEVDIMRSSDPDCDWANYATCNDAELLVNVSGQSHVFEIEENGVELGQTTFFVKSYEGQRSRPVSATPMRPGFAGIIQDAAVLNDRIYVAGDFEGYGMPTAPVALFRTETETAAVTGPVIDADQETHVLIEDGQGGWFIGGAFQHVNGVPRKHLARLHPDGSVDKAWNTETDDTVHDLMIVGDHLLVAGEFEEIGDLDNAPCEDRPYMTRVALADGAPDCTYGPKANDDVYRMLRDADRLFIGGGFTNLEGDNRFRHFAMLAPETGQRALTESGTPELPVRAEGDVYDVALDRDVIYIVGNFSAVSAPKLSNVERSGAAAFCLSNDPENEIGCLNHLTTWDPQTDARVHSIALGPETVYIGGEFEELAELEREYVAAVDPATGIALENWHVEMADYVHALHYDNGWLFVGGEFSGADGHTLPGLLRIGAEDGALDTVWQPKVGSEKRPGVVRRLQPANQGLVATGDFKSVLTQDIAYLAAVSLETGELDTDWLAPGDTTVDGRARTIEAVSSVAGGRVFVGGNFRQVGENPRAGAAAFHAETGGSLDWNPELNRTGTSFPAIVRDLTHHDGHVYLIGNFDQAGAEDREFLVRVDDDPSGGDVDTGTGNPQIRRPSTSIDPTVRAVTIGVLDGQQHVLVAGLRIEEIAGEPRDNLGALVDDNFTQLHGLETSTSSINLRSLHSYAPDRVCGGHSFGSTLSCWDQAGNKLNGIPDFTDGEEDYSNGANVWAIAGDSQQLLIGGDFVEIDDDGDLKEVGRFAILDNPSDNGFDPVEDVPYFDGSVRAIVPHGDDLIVVGDFRRVDGDARSRIVLLDENLEAKW